MFRAAESFRPGSGANIAPETDVRRGGLIAVAVEGEKAFFSLPITKIEDADDGAVFVYGPATTDDLDLDDQVVDKEFAKSAMTEWFETFANVRQMHSTDLAPAGRGVELDDRGDSGQWIKAKVVEPGAIKLTKEGVYQAFSVGLTRTKVIRDAQAPNGRIIDGVICEVSLVDRPANPSCKFAVVKSASVAVTKDESTGEETAVAEDWSVVEEHELLSDEAQATIDAEAPEEAVEAANEDEPAEEPEEEAAEAAAETAIPKPGELQSLPTAGLRSAHEQMAAVVMAAAEADVTKADADGMFMPMPYAADGDETVCCPCCGAMNSDDARFCDQCGSCLVGLYIEEKGAGLEVSTTTVDEGVPEIDDVPGNRARQAAAKPDLPEDFAAALEEAVAAKVADVMEERDNEIAGLKAELRKMAGEPDPARAPTRGGHVVEPATEDEQLEDTSKAAQSGEDAELARKRHYLREQQLHHPSAEIREAARAALEKLGEPTTTK